MTTLTGVLPETQAAYNALDAYARSIGVSIAVANYGGLRTQADTNQILQYRVDDYNAARARGTVSADTTLNAFRPIAPFGSSYHNYGAAFDVDIRGRPSSMSVSDALQYLAQAAPAFGLRWGGQFTNPDPPHFELAIPLSDAQNRYRNAVASSNTASDPWAFDLSSFLPGLTPGDDVTPTLEVGDVYASGDDAGDAVLSDEPSQGSEVPLLAFGLLVAGVVAWALRRKFL